MRLIDVRMVLVIAGLLTAGFGQAQPKPAAGAGANTAPAGGPSGVNVAALFDDPVLARGDGVEVRQSRLEQMFVNLRANLAARGQPLPPEQRTFREAVLLEQLINHQLMAKRATAEDKAKARDLAEKMIAESKREMLSEEVFHSRLKALGITMEQYAERVLEQAISTVVLERELKSKLTVSDAQVEEFYQHGIDRVVRIMQGELERLAKEPKTSVEQLTAVKQQIEELKKANLARFEQPERVRVSHILLAVLDKNTELELPEQEKRAKRREAEKVLARARAGEDFARLIQEFSEDRSVKENGGEYTLARHDAFVPEFKAAAFSLQPGQISEVVTTVFGYHIIKLHERIPARKVEFAKVAPELKEALLQQELQAQLPDYFARLKQEAKVEILEPKYRMEK